MNNKQDNIAIIPQPVKLVMRQSEFIITSLTVIAVDRQTEAAGRQLASMLCPATGYPLDVRSGTLSESNCIVLKIEPSLAKLGSEGYQIEVTPNQIIISALALAGIFYGSQTLRQLLPNQIFYSSKIPNIKWVVPCVEIEDYPRFVWRGLMLDTARYYMPTKFIKKFIDLIAIHKMNIFHWHLYDDQGFRIEIKKYPKLTEIGAWRKETIIGRNTEQYDGKPHGGYYTQDEIREIVAYAKRRFVSIIPEIEMPGHCISVLAAYPELSCTGGSFEVKTRWSIMQDVFCAGNENVFEFLADVLTEVIELFPSEYIHIGGDECPKNRWKACPKCQAKIKEQGLADENELQGYFVRRIEKFLNSRGKRLIGWDEILEGGLAPNATVMSWRGETGGVKAAQAGHDVIMAPDSYTYLDYYQGEVQREPIAHSGYLPLERVYAYEPIPEVLTKTQRNHILGVQGQVWTEYIATPELAEYMTYPRACALVETAWTSAEHKEFSNFYNRLERHLVRLDILNVNYRRLDPPMAEIGCWSSMQADKKTLSMDWELTSHLNGPGDYSIHFSYAGRLYPDVKEIQILCDNKIIAKIANSEIAEGQIRSHTFKFILPKTKMDGSASYQLRAYIESSTSDSNGVVYISKEQIESVDRKMLTVV